MKIKNLFFIASFLLLLNSCKKEEAERYPLEPTIELISVSPLTVTNFDNKITVTLSYLDNNGDLGFSDPDKYSLQIQDSRLDSADWYHVPPLAPENENIIIEGQLSVVITNMFILGNGNSEVTSLKIKMRDRENHWSNEVISPTITIQKP